MHYEITTIAGKPHSRWFASNFPIFEKDGFVYYAPPGRYNPVEEEVVVDPKDALFIYLMANISHVDKGVCVQKGRGVIRLNRYLIPGTSTANFAHDLVAFEDKELGIIYMFNGGNAEHTMKLLQEGKTLLDMEEPLG